ncbi:MAG: hypothetical protein JWP03_519 [Phycisphaerales bacterium]|jgi:hypothetical protein|nr:hypothetical protein [Phycisphaerales bacterium]
MDSNHTKGAIHYLVGDATAPQGDGPRIIAHVCNDLGRWGRGFVLALSKRWHEPEARFRAWHRNEVQGGRRSNSGRFSSSPSDQTYGWPT